jgi:hypothetical protein
MITKRNNIQDYSKVNSEFNQSMESLVTTIFQAQTIGLIEYVQCQRFSETETKRSAMGAEMPAPTPAPDGVEPVSSRDLGVSEYSLLTKIAYGGYTNILVRGEIGSGKTATCREVLRHFATLPLHEKCNECIFFGKLMPIEINFHDGYPDDTDSIMNTFRDDYYDSLRTRLQSIFIDKNLLDNFIEVVIQGKYGQKLDIFNDFIIDVMQGKDWDSKHPSDQDKNRSLFSWIDKADISKHHKIRLISKLGFYLKHATDCKYPCLVVFFDNLDYLPVHLQLKIARNILSIQEISKIRTIVTVRPSLRGKIDNALAFDYDRFEQNGPDPIFICRKRIEHFLDKKNRGYYSVHIKDEYNNHVESLRNRMSSFVRKNDELGADQKAVRDRIELTLRALSCKSIRRALRLAERLFINTVLPISEGGMTNDNLAIALLVGRSQSRTMDYQDDYVSNILICPESGKYSFLSIRILMLLYNPISTISEGRPLSILISNLKDMDDWTDSEIRSALNYLMHPMKQLIYTTGRDVYATDEELLLANSDRVVLTPLGANYLIILLRNLRYLQESLLPIDWDEDSGVPPEVDYGNIVERFSLFRRQLNAMTEIDKFEFLEFKQNLVDQDRLKEYKNLYLISGTVVRRMGKIFFRIFNDLINDSIVKNEWENWLSLINVCLENERKLRGIENIALLELSDKFSSMLNSKQK